MYSLNYSIVLGPGLSGLTLKYQLVSTSGTPATATALTSYEQGTTGTYLAQIPLADGYSGGVRILNAADDSILAFAAINPQEAENADTKTSTRAPAGTTVVITSPFTVAGDVIIVVGDSYDATVTTSLAWTNAGGTWPALTGATITLAVDGLTTFAGMIDVATGAGQKVHVDLLPADTRIIGVGMHIYGVYATWAGTGDRVTLAKGNARGIPSQGPTPTSS